MQSNVERDHLPGAFKAAGLVAVGWLAFYAAWLAAAPGGARGLTVFSDTVYLVPIAAAAGLSALASFRAGRGKRVFWALLAVSNTSWLLAEAAWSIRELAVGNVPFPWWTDPGYYGWYVLTGAAIVFAFRPSLRTVRPGVLLDGLLVVGALALAWWWVVLRSLPLGADLASLVGLSYPSLDLALLGLLVSTRLLPSRRGTVAMNLVLAAVLAAAVTDGLYVELAVEHSYVSGSRLDLGWQVQACLLALAASAAVLRVDRRSDWARWRPPTRLAPAAIVSGAALVVVLVVVGDALGDGRLRVSTLVLSGALGAMIAARLTLLAASGVRERRLAASGVHDAGYLQHELRRQLASAQHFDEPFGLALLEPQARKGLESAAAGLVAGAAREIDVVCRLDQGRLCVLLPRVGDAEAKELAEHLRAASGEEQASVGVSVWQRGDSSDDLLERAERLLDAARLLGGNVVRGPETDLLFDAAARPELRLRQFRELAAALDARGGADPEHSARVAALARSLAAELALEPAEAEAVELAALLHAVARVSLPDAQLARDPRDALCSADLVARIPSARDAAPIVAAQHEYWDGSGTPRGLAGSAIPLGARIVGVAHEVVSLLEGTRHGAAFSLTGALTEIWRHADRRFDPVVVGALFRLLREGRLENLPSLAS